MPERLEKHRSAKPERESEQGGLFEQGMEAPIAGGVAVQGCSAACGGSLEEERLPK